MFVTALCPTFRHPELLANSLALWNAQTYPAEKRHMIILDDDPTFYSQRGPNWRLVASPNRLRSLPSKYNMMIRLAPKETELFIPWEDDDIYLPDFITKNVEALQGGGEFSKSGSSMTDCGAEIPGKRAGSLCVENGEGLFHSSMVFRKTLLDEVGGGWIETDADSFDLQILGRLQTRAREKKTEVFPWPACDPNPRKQTLEEAGPEAVAQIQFIYRWHTGSAHCQWTMGRPEQDWYQQAEKTYKKVPYVGKLEAKYDPDTLNYILPTLGIKPCT